MALTKRDLHSILRRSKRVTSEDVNSLVEHYIEVQPPGYSASEAVIRNGGVPVWAIVGYVPAVDGNLDQIAEDYNLPLDAVIASIYYYRQNKAAIDGRIEANYTSAEAS